MNLKIRVLVLAFVFPTFGFAQSEPLSQEPIASPKSKTKYWTFGVGSSFASVRDFATSPLVYRGQTLIVTGAREKTNDKRYMRLGVQYNTGRLVSNFNNNGNSTKISLISASLEQLYAVPKLSSAKQTVKAGGIFRFFSSNRVNSGFQNAALGLEFFSGLGVKILADRDISRTKAKPKKIWFLKFKRPKVKRAFSYGLDFGVLNSQYRNGFAYVGQSAVVNDPKIFDVYEFKGLTGLRVNTEIKYTKFLENGNGVQLGYSWEAIRSAKEPEQFEFARHMFKLSFLFNTIKHN